jgi:hypothetical protein
MKNKKKEREQSATCYKNQTDKMRVQRCSCMREYRGEKRSKDTLPPSPEEDEEVDTMADPPPSPEPEQDAEVMNAVEVLMTMNKAPKRSEQIKAKKCSHHDGASNVETILPVTKPRPQFPKRAPLGARAYP